jgi:hypothetical protein
MTKPAQEKLVMAKELTDLFANEGVTIHYHYAREIIAACPQAVRRRYIRFSDAWSWWVLNPGFQPFSEKGPKSDTTRTLSTLLDTNRQ